MPSFYLSRDEQFWSQAMGVYPTRGERVREAYQVSRGGHAVPEVPIGEGSDDGSTASPGSSFLDEEDEDGSSQGPSEYSDNPFGEGGLLEESDRVRGEGGDESGRAVGMGESNGERPSKRPRFFDGSGKAWKDGKADGRGGPSGLRAVPQGPAGAAAGPTPTTSEGEKVRAVLGAYRNWEDANGIRRAQ